ncbi:unnamed protein product [Fusarium graminearum]|uniref:MACPF-like domain-containing protein n=1 Tax=Gibberella zeae TaxID=5518 RepID=A0A2H3G2K0_GIBZA|nr:hypothetical protein FGRA07_11279 [Fusarium graminearum]CAF3525719.1 unnamed protein product [Fusarium graminearum]CAG1960664.1 unnamed protein product [Fusarium graminearum]CAG1962428.1 unnamed protein product [Fusarium graminearum]CAG1964031.1 unnamed protein product [Fusarium graminearum]
MSPTQVLRVSRFDPASATSKEKQIIQLDEKAPRKTLRDIRTILRDNDALEAKDLKSPFCEKNGSDVDDTMPLELYLTLLGNENPSEGDLDVYFKSKKIFTPIDQATKDMISEKLDLAFQQEPELIKKNPELLTSSFNPNEWKAVKGEISHVADLTERQWSVIIRMNCLLSGHRIMTTQYEQNGKPMQMSLDGIERSPYNAFKIKAREFEAYEISSEGLYDPKDKSDKEYSFRIPRFRVDDDSSVTVVETKTSFEKSMVDSSFSETAFQVAASGSLFGVSVGVKAGGAKASSDNSLALEARDESSLVVNYNYPRVTLYWDAKSLEVSEECLEDIKKVKDHKTLGSFNEKYGHIFSKRVQIGGRLSSSEKVTSTQDASTQSQIRKLKANASASVSSSFFQASASYSNEKQSNESKSSDSKSLNKSMAWEATGGDTLLCNSPAQWCSTVSHYENWRIVNQDEVVRLSEFLAEFPEVKKINENLVEYFKKCADTY